MARKTAKDIKALIEADKQFKTKLDSLNIKVDDFIAASDETKKATSNDLYDEFRKKFPDAYGIETEPVPPTPICGGHSHWNGTACECDPGYHDLNGECVPNEQPPEPPQPNPAGVIYDSNTDGQWNNGVSRIVKGHDGNISPNGKGLFTAASGSPEVHIDGKGTAILVTKPGFGRFYLCVCNFNAQLDFDFNIMDSSVDNMSIKGRSRHQSGGAPANRFGGLGNATSTKDTDFKIEDYHNVHEKGYNQNLPKPLKVGEWYHKRYIYHNVPSANGQTEHIKMEDWIDYNDGNGLIKVFERTETKPIAAAMDKAMFDKESWVWNRLNGSGSIAFKNYKITAL